MKTYLVTGAAGFIGANYVKYMLATYTDCKIYLPTQETWVRLPEILMGIVANL